MTFLKTLIIVLLTIVLCSACVKKEKRVSTVEEIDLVPLLDVQIPGWKAGLPRTITQARDMQRYMGRSADLCPAYGFKKLVIKEFKNAKSLSIVAEAYELDSDKNAYGFYSFDTTGRKLDIGQGAVYGHGVLKFWKGRILIRVIAREEFRQLESNVITLGRQIDSKMTTEGSKPELISLVPEERLIPDSVHFFHENICLNNIFYIPESTALNLSKETDVVTAQYSFGGGQFPQLIMIQYPDKSMAKTALEAFSASYFGEQTLIYEDQNIKVIRTEEGEYNSITINGKFVILVFESRSRDTCRQLAGAVLEKID